MANLTISRTSSDHFFSFTSSQNEFSLILSKSAAETLHKARLDVAINPSTWKAILLAAGASGFENSMVNSVARILAQEQICLYYMSTWNQDFILVEATQLNGALKILKKLLTREYK